MWRRGRIGAVLLLASLGLAPALAPTTSARESHLMRACDRAYVHARSLDPRLVRTAVPAALTGPLAILRRARTGRDVLPRFARPQVGYAKLWPRGVRLAGTGLDHTRLFLAPGIIRAPYPAACRRLQPLPIRRAEVRQLQAQRAGSVTIVEVGGRHAVEDSSAFSVSDISHGDFELMTRSHHILAHGIGLAPDGVAAVRINPPRGRSVTAVVQDNVFLARMRFRLRPNADVYRLRWLDADGDTIRRYRVVIAFTRLRPVLKVLKPKIRTIRPVVHPAPGTQYP